MPEIQRIDTFRWKVRKEGKMRVDGLIYASESMIEAVRSDQSLEQTSNVACLPGIIAHSFAMPDVHSGYGFPIGGVAAFDMDEGVVSPGGVGYDINCGVRLLRTGIHKAAIENRIKDLVTSLFNLVPSGVGSRRKDMKLSHREEREVMKQGAAWAVSRGFGEKSDLDFIEEGGCIQGADPDVVSDRAVERGLAQLGTLGSGNHFVEVGFVAEVYDDDAAARMGLTLDDLVVTIHTGSRGFGHQICEDYIKKMLNAANKYNIFLPDKQLCCAPIRSAEGRQYLSAMAAAANYAFANRQMITHWVREALKSFLEQKEGSFDLVYDVCHNIAKFEEHEVGGGERRKVCVHRKGATRAFPPGHPALPDKYKEIGQPVLIPGDMGRYSYVLVGTSQAYSETFGSTCHGAGRLMSRHQAIRACKGRAIAREMEDSGVIVRAASRETLMEEIPDAYKDVADVVEVVHQCGLSRKVVKLKPLGVIKG
jgi:tRNA-splicing ligase RtcB